MFKRKLRALDYLDWDKVDGNSDEHLRKVVVWLEEQKIRHYKIDERKGLRDITSNDWPQVYQKYCDDLACPVKSPHLAQLEWLIYTAVKDEVNDLNVDTFKRAGCEATGKKESNVAYVKSTNPIDNLDFDSNEFKEGVSAIADLLKVPKHTNHLVTLESCCKLVQKRLNPAALSNPDAFIVKGKPFPIMETISGRDFKDPVLSNVAKILTLLHVQDLRDLQTKINETIVDAQVITANPKTDTKLGKVGF